MMKRKIAFIGTDWNDNEYRKKYNKYGGCSYYRLVKPMELLKDEYDVTFFGSNLQRLSKGKSIDEFYDQFTRKYDMIVIKQVDNAQAAQTLLHWCSKNGCVLVQDFDDNMLSVREDQPAYEAGYKAGGQRMAFAASMMSLVDALIVSTQPLKDFYGKYIKNVFNEDKDIYLFPNYNDITDWAYPQSQKDQNKVVIGWVGSITHDEDLKSVMEVLGEIVDTYDNVYVEFMGGVLQGKVGYLLEDWTEKAREKFKVIFGTYAVDTYFPKLRAQSWDIAIAPIIDDEFNRGKSHCKWLEYSMCGWPVIASKVYPYYMDIEGEHTIQHNETGLLASTKGEWKQHLVNLIENPIERKRLSDNAYKHIKDNLQWKQHKDKYIKIVSDIFEKYAFK